MLLHASVEEVVVSYITWLVSDTQVCPNSSLCVGVVGKTKEKKRLRLLASNLMRSEVFYRAAQVRWSSDVVVGVHPRLEGAC